MSVSADGSRVKVVRKRLADGSVKEYRYDLAAIKAQKEASSQRRGILRIYDEFRESPEYRRLSAGWQKAIGKYVGIIDQRIGYMTLVDLAGQRARGEFFALRDEHAGTPAKADKIVSTLRLLLGWAYQRGTIGYNHAVGIERLVPSSHSRAERIWDDESQRLLLEHARQDVQEAFLLALYTLAREADLCALKWRENFSDGRWLVYTPSKTGHSTAATVHLPVYRLEPLAALMASLSRCTDHILSTEQHAHPWTTVNLSKYFGKARTAARLDGADLTWHDIRGTGMTQLYLAGCTDAEVASISGHVMGDRAQQRSYIARARGLAEHAYDKWNRYLTGSAAVVKLVSNNRRK